MIFLIFCREISREICQEFRRIVFGPQNEGSKIPEQNSEHFSLRNFVAQKTSFVQTSFCRRATLRYWSKFCKKTVQLKNICHTQQTISQAKTYMHTIAQHTHTMSHTHKKKHTDTHTHTHTHTNTSRTEVQVRVRASAPHLPLRRGSKRMPGANPKWQQSGQGIHTHREAHAHAHAHMHTCTHAHAHIRHKHELTNTHPERRMNRHTNNHTNTTDNQENLRARGRQKCAKCCKLALSLDGNSF